MQENLNKLKSLRKDNRNKTVKFAPLLEDKKENIQEEIENSLLKSESDNLNNLSVNNLNNFDNTKIKVIRKDFSSKTVKFSSLKKENENIINSNEDDDNKLDDLKFKRKNITSKTVKFLPTPEAKLKGDTNKAEKVKFLRKKASTKSVKLLVPLLPKSIESKEAKEMNGTLYFIAACIIIGITAFHIKLTKVIFPDYFDSNMFMFWRSFACGAIAMWLIKHRDQRLVPISEIRSKKWFFVRSFMNYFNMIAFILCMLYLRVGTATCMSSMSPAVTIFFSIQILGEKFHIRYIIGIFICFSGAATIILNEKKAPTHAEDIVDDVVVHEHVVDYTNMLLGGLFGTIHLFMNGLFAVSQKILAVEKIPADSQIFYVGMSNALCAFVYAIFTFTFKIHILFALFCCLNGVLFYIIQFLQNEALKRMDLAKSAPYVYLSTITVFLCGVLFLGEQLYLSDIMGSMMILAWNVYNSFYPVK